VVIIPVLDTYVSAITITVVAGKEKGFVTVLEGGADRTCGKVQCPGKWKKR